FLFMVTPPTQISTLSLHDALPIFKANGRRRTLISLTHGTMANAMPQALGAKRAFPDRQVISMSGDGGLSMLLGDLLTAIQEKIPDRKSTRLNSSHVAISYAVFCLK